MAIPGFSGATALIIGDDTNEFLQGTNLGEVILAEGGDDVVAGGGLGFSDDGDDIIDGGSGNDTLTGGTLSVNPSGDLFVASDTTGIDSFDGGSGADIFVLGGISQDGQTFIYYDTPDIADYAFIGDFIPGSDKLFLAPAPEGTEYTLGTTPGSGQVFSEQTKALFLGEEVIAVIDSNGIPLDLARDAIIDVA